MSRRRYTAANGRGRAGRCVPVVIVLLAGCPGREPTRGTGGATNTNANDNAPENANDNSGGNDNTGGVTGAPGDCNTNGIRDDLEVFPDTSLTTVEVASGLSEPVYVTAPPGDFGRLFIVEQGGTIRILNLPSGLLQEEVFLDITDRVTSGGERGLLGLAFHPQYASNGFLYVDYTDEAGDTVIARYSTSTDPNAADAESESVLKHIDQDFSNHNGGQLAFGPDGYLYVGMGDGGSGFDPNNRAQDLGTLLGKILRLDVDRPPDYIAESNPFVGESGARGEIWSLGLRNPWRFSFDRATGDLYIGDVGQNDREEIDFQPADREGGENYGWRCLEGDHCTSLTGCACSDESLTGPIVDIPHDGNVCSVIGGYVYRGCAMPDLSGTYFYADYCAGWIRSFRLVDGRLEDERDRTTELTPDSGPIASPVSFGEDAAGELYIVSQAGSVYRIVPAG